MSDFLDRIAARSVGGTPTLSPRLPSWFEPPRDTTAALAVEDTEAAPAPTVARAMEAPTATAKPRPLPAPSTMPPHRTAAPPPAPDMPSEKRAAATERDIPHPPLRDSVLRVVETVLQRIERPGDRANEARHATPQSAMDRPAPTVPPSSALHAEPPLLAPPRQTLFASPAGRDGQALPPGQRPPARDKSNASSVRAEPVVHVSIGRLEVRAAPAAATSASRRKEGARPASLDDYLRQLPGRTP